MKREKKNILITGCAGFIGFHLSNALIKSNQYNVYGIDNLNNYYSKKLKNHRLNILRKNKKLFKFSKIDISNKTKLKRIFQRHKYDIVINLAAQAGVRYSIENPDSYFKSNINGFFNILNCSLEFKVSHLLFASTSSVYGNTKKFPITENFNTDKPLSFYAASKKCNEVMAYSYSNIHKIPITAMRFFTVYGPLGRPDMSLFKFTKLIKENKKIDLFNNGNHVRDFTYIDDVVESIMRLINKKPKKPIPFNVYNVCSSNPVKLKKFINEIEKKLDIKSKKNFKSMQLGDVHKTHGSNKKILKVINYKPVTNIEIGIKKFTNWYNNFFK